MITIQIVLHMKYLSRLGGRLSWLVCRKVESEMIEGIKDHRVAYRAD